MSEPGGRRGNNRVVLLVEDDPNDVVFFRHAVDKASMSVDVQVASDGEQALEFLKGTGRFADPAPPLPILTFLDLKMPRLPGMEVLRFIRQTPGLKRLVVIVLTSSSNRADLDRAFELGANAYLVKPADTDQLEGILRAVNQFWLMPHNRFPVVTRPGGSDDGDQKRPAHI